LTLLLCALVYSPAIAVPRPAHQVDFRNAAPFQDVIRRGAEVTHGYFRRHDRYVRGCRLAHFRRPRRTAIASDIDQINVVSARSDQLHHRRALDRQIKGGFGWISRAVHVKQNLVGRKRRYADGTFVAHVELDPGVIGRNQIALGYKLRKFLRRVHRWGMVVSIGRSVKMFVRRH